uniref:glycosyltransferase n=1 Tax=Flavobacterium croceum TaxID=370975 RepID=UPI0024A8778E
DSGLSSDGTSDDTVMNDVLDFLSNSVGGAIIKETINYITGTKTSQDMIEVEFQCFNNIEIHNNPTNIADIYARNQIAIVAGGVTTYELAYLKTPMILIPFAHNQMQNAILWDKFHFGICYLKPDSFIKNLKKNGLQHIINELNKKFCKRNVSIDGNGAKRIVKIIKDFIYEKTY